MPGSTAKTWKRIAIASLVVVAFGAWLVSEFNEKKLREISIDQSHAFAKDFFSKTGYPFLKVRTSRRNRERVDHISFVGRDRSTKWFEDLGFDANFPREQESLEEWSTTGIVYDGSAPRDAITMSHSKVLFLFTYWPSDGILLSTDDWDWKPGDSD